MSHQVVCKECAIPLPTLLFLLCAPHHGTCSPNPSDPADTTPFPGSLGFWLLVLPLPSLSLLWIVFGLLHGLLPQDPPELAPHPFASRMFAGGSMVCLLQMVQATSLLPAFLVLYLLSYTTPIILERCLFLVANHFFDPGHYPWRKTCSILTSR